MIWHDLLKLINDHNRFVISSHLSLDGDSVGSQLAFYWYLNSLGKEVILFDIDPVPAKFVFLKNTDLIQNRMPEGKYVLVVLDCSNPGRMGWSPPSQPQAIINILLADFNSSKTSCKPPSFSAFASKLNLPLQVSLIALGCS